MTEDQHEALVDVGNYFWDELGKLAARCIAQFPEDVEHEVTPFLQDKCSIYGTIYSEHLAKLRKESQFAGLTTAERRMWNNPPHPTAERRKK